MKKKAFTLIEILVVIVIFWVGILGILTMLTRSIGYFDTINMQTRATMLAKEALDLAYQHRDSNLDQGYPRNFVGREWAGENSQELFWEAGHTYKIWFDSQKNGQNWENYYHIQKVNKPEHSDFWSLFKAFEVEFFTWNNENPDLSYYRYASSENNTNKGFARWIEFSSVDKWDWSPFDPKKLLKVSAHALYQRGGNTWEVVLEGFIGLKDSSVESQ